MCFSTCSSFYFYFILLWEASLTEDLISYWKKIEEKKLDYPLSFVVKLRNVSWRLKTRPPLNIYYTV